MWVCCILIEHNDLLGYIKDYRLWILSGVLILYGLLYSFLHKDLEMDSDDI
jgi:hypothetical protein